MRLVRNLLLAVRFLTIVPLPQGREDTVEDLGQAMYWFPLVGMAIGAAAGWCLIGVMMARGGPPVEAAVALAVLAVLTGALHLDGLSDTCDGLIGGRTREDRLRIMKDKATGTFGLVAVVLVLLFKWSCLVDLAHQNRCLVVVSIAAAVGSGRWAQVIAAGMCPYARPDGGTGRDFVSQVGLAHVLASPLSLCALWAVSLHWIRPQAALVAGVSVLGTTLGICACSVAFFRSRIGGVTGDTLGCLSELVEVGVLVCFRVLVGNGVL